MLAHAGRTKLIAASLLVVLAAFGGPSPASAQARARPPHSTHVAIIVPPHADAGIASGLAEHAARVLSRALKADHFSVIAPDQAVAIGESVLAEGDRQGSQRDQLRECATADCAIWYRAVLNADAAMHLTLAANLGPASSGKQPDRVTLVIARRPDLLSSGSAKVVDGDLSSAVLASYRAAREQPGTRIDSASLAKGSESEPARAVNERLAEGVAEEPAPDEQPQTASVGADSAMTLRLRASKTRSAKSARRPWFLRANAWDYTIGGALMVVGAAHLVQYFIVKGRSKGACAERSTNGCTAVYAPSATDTRLLAGVGTAGIALGALVIFEGPIGRLSARADTRSAHLTFRGSF